MSSNKSWLFNIPDENSAEADLPSLVDSTLKKEVLSRDSYFLDIYTLTSTKDGENNNLYMCDKTHISPKCLSVLFESHQYEPDSFIIQ